MKTLTNLSVASLGALLIVGTADAASATQFLGDSQPLGEGFARSFVTLDDQGNPEEVGVILTKEALSLPIGDTEPDISKFLSLPPEASATAFNHIQLTYRPHGYPWLPEVFGVPRITIDTFLISPQERNSICPNGDTPGSQPSCGADELAKVLKQPDPDVAPPGLLPTGIVEPGFGTRYFDPDVLSPIQLGQRPFTNLYDYGFYDGQVSFIGFGGTKAFLETQPNVTNPIKVPTSYPQNGYYPTEYSITFDATRQEYKLALTGLKYRAVPEPSLIIGTLTFGAVSTVSFLHRKQKQMT